MTIDANAMRSRRRFLAAIAAAASGVVAATMTGAQRVLAAGDDGEVIHVGDYHDDVRSGTYLFNQSNDSTTIRAGNYQKGTAIWGESSDGRGVFGDSNTNSGVKARSLSGTGLHATSGIFEGEAKGAYPAAVLGEVALPAGVSILGNNYATSGAAQGVQGTTDSPAGYATTGWARRSGAAIVGASGPTFPANVPTRTGVFGYAQQGRGGVFAGPAAQVQLKASGAASHPASGAKGDLFVDRTGRLWFCKGGTSWKQLA